MIKNKYVNIKLNRVMLLQILDGLENRAKTWEETYQYLKTGSIDDYSVIEECDNLNEAEKIANDYRQIIKTITNQLTI